ncbi:MAG TPA: preprotein translocase subunit SecY [Phycisphaerae bacterium]|nr:preprotein translocase subunit SecY [Phycisphaerae bacterium]HNU44471.1 preprotein translocase subunit SecY [Phycisphaerae bacterium]
MFQTLINIFKIPELRNKVLFTLGMLAIYRIGYYVPVPGVDQAEMYRISQGGGGLGDLAEYFQIFTGGNLRQSTIFGLGIMPYISASIILQLLVTVVPSLEKLHKEGEAGRKKINEYTRYSTVGLCIIQAMIWVKYLAANKFIFSEYTGPFMGLSFTYLLMTLALLTSGTVFLMWLGEQIDEYGIGNGISLIITAGIVVRMPNAIILVVQNFKASGASDRGQFDIPRVLLVVAMFVAVVAGAILITQAQRRIPIQQAKQTRGRRVYGGQRQYMPLRVNHGGVMPIIFASSMLIFPGVIFDAISRAWPNAFWHFLSTQFRGEHGYVYVVSYILAVYFFAYFWTTVQFQPKEMANNLRDYGSFVPGLRPGKRTADYLERVMSRITYVGAAFLAIIAIIPNLVAQGLSIPFEVSAFLGGTGLLIVVSVTLDFVQRIEANLIMRNYKGFLGDAGPIKGSRS